MGMEGLGAAVKSAATVARADLIGSTTATAAGITAQGSTPVLALCRRMIAAGHDPATQLEVYRGATLALTIRSIGEAAGLEINGKGTGFRRSVGVGTASPMRQSQGAGTSTASPVGGGAT